MAVASRLHRHNHPLMLQPKLPLHHPLMLQPPVNAAVMAYCPTYHTQSVCQVCVCVCVMALQVIEETHAAYVRLKSGRTRVGTQGEWGAGLSMV